MVTLKESFSQYFDVHRATDDEILAIYKLRYEIYTREYGYEPPNELGVETDKFDEHSAHIALFYKPTNQLVGCTRLILSNDSQKFAMYEVCDSSIFVNRPLDNVAEISRFALLKEFRQPANKEIGSLARIGLMRGITQISLDLKLSYWYAMMEAPLLRDFSKFAVYFENIGRPIDLHGMRQPCYGKIESILEEIKRKKHPLWEFLTQ